MRRGTARSPLLIGATAAGVGFLYGYDLSNIAGALLFIESDFGLSSAQQQLVVTATGVGAIVGAASGGWLANAIGRKKSMILLSLGYAVFAVLGAASVSVPMLVATRSLLGVTVGWSLVVVPVFLAESAPAAVRGALMVAYGVATIVGIIAGYLVDYLLADTQNWRAMLGVAALPAVTIAVLLLQVPDTARWYLLNGRIASAQRALRRVEPGVDAERELAEIARVLREEQAVNVGLVRELLRPPYLRALVFVVSLGFFTQITGINAIVYYSPRLFENMGFTGNFALLILPALVQVAELAAKLLSLVLIDRVGRRPILLSGIAVMVVANLILVGVFTAGPFFGAALTSFQFTGVLLFTVGYAAGFGALLWVYAGESLPARLRSIGSSAMLTANLVASAITVAVFLTLLTSLGGAVTFAVLGALAVASFVFVYRYAPETKGRQLEDIRHFWENGGRWPEQIATDPTTM